MSRTVNESIKNKPENSGKSAAGKGAGAGAKKASSGAEPAVKAGKAGTSRNNRKKGPQYHKGRCKGKNHPFLRGSKISQEKGFCRD